MELEPQNLKNSEDEPHVSREYLRHDILEHVLTGKKRPGEADRWAEQEGLEPFVKKPDPTKFHVMDLPSWSLAMVLAWVIWRDQDKVAEYHTPFREQWTFWKPRGGLSPHLDTVGYDIATKDPAKIYDVWSEGTLRAAAAKVSGCTDDIAIDYDEAKQSVWSHLEKGRIKAHGRNLDTAEHEEIEHFRWAGLKPIMDRKQPGDVGYGPSYESVRCELAGVLAAWPQVQHAKRGPPGLKPKRELPSLPVGTMVYLGEIIYWMATDRGTDLALLSENWDEAERELIAKCAARELIASGQPADAAAPYLEAIDWTVWTAGTVNGTRALHVSTIDETLGSELGGQVSLTFENSNAIWRTWVSVGIPVEQVHRAWPPHNAPEKRKVIGRRSAYDWAAFSKAAFAKLEEEGAFDPSVDTGWNKAALERHMAEWCHRIWGKEPSESTIRAKLSEIEAAYLEGRKGQ